MDIVAFLWAILLAAWALVLGGAIGVLGMSPPRLKLAKALFVLAGILLWIVAIMIGLTVPVSAVLRIIVAFFIGGIASAITVGCWLWVNGMPVPIVEHPRPANEGVLSAEKVLSPEQGIYPEIEIGNSGAVFVYAGDTKAPAFVFMNESRLTVEKSVSDIILVSVDVRDEAGQLIAKLIRNEWMVAPPPKTWDRNYNESALEIIDNYGRVILQVRLIGKRVQLQGLWWSSKPGIGCEMVENPSGDGALFVPLNPTNNHVVPIKEMFHYPSAMHFGELIKN